MPIFSGQSLLYPVDDEHCWSVETKEVRVNDALSILRVLKPATSLTRICVKLKWERAGVLIQKAGADTAPSKVVELVSISREQVFKGKNQKYGICSSGLKF